VILPLPLNKILKIFFGRYQYLLLQGFLGITYPLMLLQQCAVHVFMADAIGFSWKASKNGLTNFTNDNVTELDNVRLPQLLTTEIYGD
jgi:hypothetical protein